ncbi:tRNA-dihydrouridine synthase B [Leclercia adecarboxylata]|uniref:tRNA-dihydrouridine synthase B n=1 Tax=Leclercia adecarboxylata TaxID=83655 RepID=A0A4U9IS64_9ENTR|nr:tRNA-dihydrouridine synthase B [Leclercia adecarboxylata]
MKSILTAVVSAVDVPVTLKIRTGWSPDHRNCVEIAQLAEDCGIQALTIHGRTRACLFNGEAEYDSIRAVKQKVSIPVIANGDITDPLKARAVLDYTGADALMIGRAAQGKTLDLSGNPALSGHWGSCLPRCHWQRSSACFVRTFGNCMTTTARQKGTELRVNTYPGISRNTLQMTSFGAHSTP